MAKTPIEEAEQIIRIIKFGGVLLSGTVLYVGVKMLFKVLS